MEIADIGIDDTQHKQTMRFRKATKTFLEALLKHHALPSEPEPPPISPKVITAVMEIAFPKLPFGRIEAIQRATAAEFAPVTVFDIRSPRRNAKMVLARQVAMFIAKQVTSRSLPELGRRFGGRDHTTVLHAVRKIEHRVSVDPVLAARIERIKTALEATQ